MRTPGKSNVILRSVSDTSISAAVRECLDRCEWESVVPRGAIVVVKPNLCTAVPDRAGVANTSPAVTAAVCEALTGRAKQVRIVESDNLRQKAQEAFAASGYREIAARLGVELVNLTEVPRVRVRCDPAGAIELPRMLLESDVFITLPVLKTHALTYFTGALKNQWGCLPQYDRILLHKHIHTLLATIHKVLKPKLAIMDAIVGMEGRGPVNGRPRRMDLVLASRDAVALDATAMRLVGLHPERARHVAEAARQGLGRIAAADIGVDGDWSRHVTRFQPAKLDLAVAAMNYMSRYRWFVRCALERDSVFKRGRALVQLLRTIGLLAGD